jgi:hypothetical protein
VRSAGHIARDDAPIRNKIRGVVTLICINELSGIWLREVVVPALGPPTFFQAQTAFAEQDLATSGSTRYVAQIDKARKRQGLGRNKGDARSTDAKH